MSIFVRAYRLLGVDAWSRTRPGERVFLAAFFAYKKWLEDPHAALARKHPEVFAGGHIVDVGANAGYTATIFADAITPNFKVFAFEPEPINFARLQRVTRNKVTCIQSAVGDIDGTAALLRNPDHPGDHRIATEGGDHVPITTLDTFAANLHPIKFIKIDVQGHELAVLRGMTQLIDRNPALEISCEYSGERDVIRFLEERGFTLHLLKHNGDLRPLDEADAVVRKRGYCDLLATRRTRA